MSGEAGFQQYSSGGRFFGELKGVRITKRAGTETWSGSGLLGGLLVTCEVMAHEEGRVCVVTNEMFGLACKDVLKKVGPLWAGEHVYIKTARDNSKYVNLKTAKSLGGEEAGDEW